MNILDRLTRPEGKTLEFRRDLSSPRNLLKTLVAFANSAGGRLVLGVDDERRLVGLESPLDDEERLCSLIADSITPRLVPAVELVTVDDKTLLVAEVFLSGTRPHWLAIEGSENGVYVRLGSTNRRADRELIAELRRSVDGVAFDEMPMPALSVDDLDLVAMNRLFGRTLRENDLLTLRLLTRDQGALVPTKGAVLLFGRDRMLHFLDAWVQCGRFVGLDKAKIFDHTELDEPLPQAAESILLFLKKHAVRSADLSATRRRDVWNIPVGILREAAINALVHADYSQRGGPVRVAFFEDRIEIENPGILLPGLTFEDMKQGVSRIRNHIIARVFRELGLIEQWGSGVRRIFHEAETQGLPEPQFEEIGMRLRCTVRLAQPLPMQRGSGPQSPTQSPTQSADPVGRFLRALVNGPLSSGELRNRLNLKRRPTFRNNYLRPALEAGYIEMTIPEKPSSRLQQYRLTAKGEKLLAEQPRSEQGQ